MSKYTLKYAKDAVRAKVKELKNDAVHDNMLTLFANNAIKRIQGELTDLGIKEYLKTAYKDGNFVTAPDDIMARPDAVRELRASTGVKASVTNSSNTYKARQPGADGNYIKVVYVSVNGDLSVTVTGLGTSASNYIITVDLIPTVTINIEASDAIKGNLIANSLIEIEQSTGAVIASTGTHQLTGGSGTGWVPADEDSVDSFNRKLTSVIEAPSESFPRYCVQGDNNAIKAIKAAPNTIKYLEITYWHYYAKLTADTDVLPVPEDWEELVLIDMERQANENLDRAKEAGMKAVEYTEMLKKKHKEYQDGLGSSIQDKSRIQASDVNN